MWDINTRKWWQPMLDALDVSEDQLPTLCESGVKIGTILPEIALELDLPDDLTLVMGGLDQA
jgi:xylulokinase